MPTYEADPWRMPYFKGVFCSKDVNIPTEDEDAWMWYAKYKWVYSKLAIAESQGFWMPLLQGGYVSADVAVVKGELQNSQQPTHPIRKSTEKS